MAVSITGQSMKTRDITDNASPFTSRFPMNSQASTGCVLPRSLETLLTVAALTLAISGVMQGVINSTALSQEVSISSNRPVTLAKANAIPPQAPLQNGTYLYGQSAKAGQIGATYLVFEVTQNNVVGAFYMPHSSFDCFNGTLQNNQMALTVRNSYENTQYPYAVALQKQSVSASTATAPTPVGLQGFHPIKRLSANDQRLLSTCKLAGSRTR
jgi:hypothetical protein